MEITYHLDVFDGPLDLLLHLIGKNKVSIYDIPIATILEQYNQTLEEMEAADLNITCDFLAMSAQLLYIKSKMLLPKYEEDTEDDPRARLVEMLLEYQKIKQASAELSVRSEIGINTYVREPEQLEPDKKYKYSHDISDLRLAVFRLFERAERKLPPPVSSFSGIVGREVYPVGNKVVAIIKRLAKFGAASFLGLFRGAQSRSEVVATFLAVLELCKTNRVDVTEDGQVTLMTEKGE